jgi:hypothetical protein
MAASKPKFEYFRHAAFTQRPRALARGLQAEGGHIGLEEHTRVRLEHSSAQRDAALFSGSARTRDYGLMASVYAVEIPERNRCAARIIRNC